MRLVADIGGTNSRLALARQGRVQPGTARSYRNDDFSGFDAVTDRFLADIGKPRITEVVVAVAGPVIGTCARLTNRDWSFDAALITDRLGAARGRLINDLTALGYAVPVLENRHLHPVAAGIVPDGPVRQSLVVGIGTGFNVSPVIQSGDMVLCPDVEMGHVTLPTGVAAALETRQPGLSLGFPTVEDCFSGRGLTRLCAALTGQGDLSPAQIVEAYGIVADLTEAVDFYADLIGCLLRDLLLAYMPMAGIYFAGSVARALLSLPAASRLNTTFQHPFDINIRVQCPLWIIADDRAGLLGCSRIAPMP
ncbi:Glucokinase [Thalassovita gelatinovora]|uniref:Glucokinase n=1 Tax=Thalassovita gelatinovora TaxID=53501 RepID=A0A0P1FK14_THAGE|nr:glucokinase [Thalassovita gelatinovora]QIZ82317.1 glucokinase [Thalassovita gelatinovora]CUH68369.1 Glucokinase [Thalassovita gelatinovora]SER19241.1 glucokinase [Thalassovita gelatinovora]